MIPENLMTMKQNGKATAIPLPCAIASFSPGTNRAEVYPSYVTNRDSDKMIGHAVDRAGQFEAVFGTPPQKKHSFAVLWSLPIMGITPDCPLSFCQPPIRKSYMTMHVCFMKS